MKATAFIMVVCMLFLTAFAGGINTARAGVSKNCCNHAAKHTPCHHNQKNDCEQGMCTSFTCNTCGFLRVEPFSIAPLIANAAQISLTPYYPGKLSTYSAITWQPPRV